MSGTKFTNLAGIKRKREPSKAERHKSKTKTRKSPSVEAEDPQATIQHLESQILESRRNYNNIATLIQTAKRLETGNDTAILAAVALCRVFSRLLSSGDMVNTKGIPESEAVIVQWLKGRYREYQDLLLDNYLRSESVQTESVGLTLLMRLVKEESKEQKEYNWKHGPLSRIVGILLLLPEQSAVRDEFGNKYFKPFDDVRYHTFQSIA